MKKRIGFGMFALAAVLASTLLVGTLLSGPRSARSRVGSIDVASGSGLAKISEGFTDAVLLATNSIDIKDKTQVQSGEVVVNDASPGPALEGVELNIRKEVVAGVVRADSIATVGSAVTGATHCNDINQGTCLPITLPVFADFPPFLSVRTLGADVTVPNGQSVALSPGGYGDISVGQGSTLSLTGGEYDVRSIQGLDDASIRVVSPVQVRVEGKFGMKKRAFVGPAAGSSITAADIIFYVAGINGSAGGISDNPAAVEFRDENTIDANIYAPNGRVFLAKKTVATGSFIAADIAVDKEVVLNVASTFGNKPPVANPGSANTINDAAVEITLTGSDPEGEDLTFSIVVQPTQGTLGAPVPIVPDPVEACTQANPPPCGIFVQPPVTSVTVTYTPTVGDPVDAVDAFTFQVADPGGLTAMAVVQINEPDVPDVTPPVDTLDAVDQSVVAREGTPAVITLQADSPGDPPAPVTFSIISLPTGTLQEGMTVIGPGDLPFVLSSPVVIYTPPGTGMDSFMFQADTDTETDTATVTIDTLVGVELAVDQTVPTFLNEPVPLTLTANRGGTGSSPALTEGPSAKAAFPLAAVAGNVADSNNDGLGDEHNNLPGPTPVLISAGVDQAGGAGSNGTVRIQIEWDISALTQADVTDANVLLRTSQGTSDSLDTFFFVGSADEDGLLTDDDFETNATVLPGVVMPIVAGESSFSFDVTQPLQQAIADGRSYFTIQGRVDESLRTGTPTPESRGLQIYSSADQNVTFVRAPVLNVTADPDSGQPALLYEILALPTRGALTDAATGLAVSEGQTFARDTSLLLRYTPDTGLFGIDSFDYRVTETILSPVTTIIDTGTVFVDVDSEERCVEVGREPGCAPGL